MKILIIENPRPLTLEHCNDVANAPLSASLNSGYALAVAKRCGWESAFIDLGSCQDNESELARRVLSENADLILVHWVYAWGNEESFRNVLAFLKQKHDLPIGAFGLFPTLACRRLAAFAPQLDFILVGEFEATLEELLNNHNRFRNISIPGLYRNNAVFIKRPLINDLSSLPVPEDVGTNCQYRTLNIAASRGCFGDCSFCFISSYYGCCKRRQRSTDSLRVEIETRLGRRDVDNLYFIDPTFVGLDDRHSGRSAEIGALLKERSLSFGFETRVDTVSRELIENLAGNGAKTVFLGIESCCETTLQRINKRITRQQIIRAVRAIQDSGMALSVGFIMFEPDSTLAELAENYKLLEELGLLSHHDQTVNMLYHSQIVLYGSKAWSAFDSQNRLLFDPKLPFEASYHFKHADVARVCQAMQKISSSYFSLFNSFYQNKEISSSERFSCSHSVNPPGIKGDQINLILKEAFLAFVNNTGQGSAKQIENLQNRFISEMGTLFY